MEATHFLTKTLRKPGESGYGLNPYSTYQYCTEDQAIAAGYGPSLMSDATKQKLQAQADAIAEAAKFAPSKVPYTVYVPSLDGYTVGDFKLMTIHDAVHTFFSVKKNGTVIGQIRELSSDDSYNLCQKNDSLATCTVIGHDASGREINREFRRGVTRYVTIIIDGTGIIFSSDSSDDDPIDVQILSALRPYVDGDSK